ncbi:unnamed protein product [Adineta ricciae]|uniref:Uncharacterized protein n=1 Tax=Adineta ricciae TaxID=249248 RepID=A0A814SZ61_ADIRI|nr:unnamed protein product [Adineta ricciae]CAF1287014.1 unnamed protein product [Adineta ricciae]
MDADETEKKFNSDIIYNKYEDLLNNLNNNIPSPIGFRIAESPIFLSNDFRDRIIMAGNYIIDFILHPDFKQITEDSIPKKWRCANENNHPHVIIMDFAIHNDTNGNLVPKLIELQGFPSIYALQADLGMFYQTIYGIPDNWNIYFNGLDRIHYFNLLKETIVGSHQPDEVVLLDINPHKQHTAADFYLTQKYLGISIVSLTDLQRKGKQLFYECQGKQKLIKRIYNRLVFDEIADKENIFEENVDLRQDLDVEWITHPHWFYRISKYILPYLKGEFIPKTYFLNQINQNLPNDLENYVLKPLFSFGGRGVLIDITKDDIKKIEDPFEWIIQEKVEYHPLFHFNLQDIKGEIRLMYLWPDDYKRPILTTNSTRLSNGKTINVRHNENSRWTGASIAFIQNSN